MATLCGICNAVPSKYKCPSCQIRYCSLACYKPHKETHTFQATQPSATTTSKLSQEVQAPQPTYNIYNLKGNPAFVDLLARYPQLKSQLAEIWRMTVPPSAPLDGSAYHSRGGKQGGRFKQERADEAAAAALGKLKDDEAMMNDGVREFVKLVAGLSDGVRGDG